MHVHWPSYFLFACLFPKHTVPLATLILERTSLTLRIDTWREHIFSATSFLIISATPFIMTAVIYSQKKKKENATKPYSCVEKILEENVDF